MYKTMYIMRRYCMVMEALKFRIVSAQSSNLHSTSTNGTVNYKDTWYLVNLPIFSIHGNHDNPKRDGGTDMLAALDLLAMSNLIK